MPDAGERGAFGVSLPSTPASIPSCLQRSRFAVAQSGQGRDPGLETAGDLAAVGQRG